MKSRRYLRIAAFIIALVGGGVAQVGVLPKKDFTLKDGYDSKFKVGDVWEYRTRSGEERSRLIITRIDESPELGIIVHVAVNGIRLANCHGGNEPDNIQHMPFIRKALDGSISRRIATGQQLPEALRTAVEEWRSAYAGNKAGVYIVSVAEAISVAEYGFRKGIDCPNAIANDKSPSHQ